MRALVTKMVLFAYFAREQMRGESLDLHSVSNQMSNISTHLHANTNLLTDRHISSPCHSGTCLDSLNTFKYLYCQLCALTTKFNTCTRMRAHTSLSYRCQGPLEKPANSSSEQQGSALLCQNDTARRK